MVDPDAAWLFFRIVVTCAKWLWGLRKKLALRSQKRRHELSPAEVQSKDCSEPQEG